MKALRHTRLILHQEHVGLTDLILFKGLLLLCHDSSSLFKNMVRIERLHAPCKADSLSFSFSTFPTASMNVSSVKGLIK